MSNKLLKPLMTRYIAFNAIWKGRTLSASMSASRPFSAAVAFVEDREKERKRKNAVFNDEKKRQAKLIPRIEKIEVVLKDVKPEEADVTLVMNKDMSTPFNCAQHIHEMYTKQSVVAELEDGTLWDMHRPLSSDCVLRFRHFTDENPKELNKIFWRSCSFLLGMVSLTFFF